MLLTLLHAFQTQFYAHLKVCYHNLNSLESISMTLKQVCQGTALFEGLNIERQCRKDKETAFCKPEEKKRSADWTP